MPVYPWQFANGKSFFKLRSPRFRVSAADAIRHGAQCIVLEEGDEEEATLPSNVACLIVDNVNRAFARACSRIVGDVHRQLTLIGVTGKGRATVCHLIECALRASGVRTGSFSSLAYRHPDSERPAHGAVPSALLLHNFLLELHRQRGTHAVVEVSAADVADDRIFGLQFDALAFTGSGAGDVERLFTEPEFHKSSTTLCAFNVDDPVGRELSRASAGRSVTFGFRSADVMPDSYSSDASGMTLQLNGRELRSPLIGRHNASNLLAAATIVAAVTGSKDACLQLQNVTPLPGYLEKLPTPIDVDVYVQSALTAESVDLALAAVREIAGSRRIVSVVACGGASDTAERPRVAKAAMNGSNVAILTSGDPGREHPASIVMGMLTGVPRAGSNRLRTIIDRRTAIEAAIREASPDGITVLFGEGLGNCDRQVAMAMLHELAAAPVRETSC